MKGLRPGLVVVQNKWSVYQYWFLTPVPVCGCHSLQVIVYPTFSSQGFSDSAAGVDLSDLHQL